MESATRAIDGDHIEAIVRSYMAFAEPKGFADPITVQSLYMQNKSLPMLEDIFDRFPNIKEANFSRNSLSALPPSFARLDLLQVLDLSFNWLQSAPTVIADLESLQELVLCGNKMCSLPPWIGYMKSLQKLKLSRSTDTAVRWIPSCLRNVSGLIVENHGRGDASYYPDRIYRKRLVDLNHHDLQILIAVEGYDNASSYVSLHQFSGRILLELGQAHISSMHGQVPNPIEVHKSLISSAHITHQMVQKMTRDISREDIVSFLQQRGYRTEAQVIQEKLLCYAELMELTAEDLVKHYDIDRITTNSILQLRVILPSESKNVSDHSLESQSEAQLIELLSNQEHDVAIRTIRHHHLNGEHLQNMQETATRFKLSRLDVSKLMAARSAVESKLSEKRPEPSKISQNLDMKDLLMLRTATASTDIIVAKALYDFDADPRSGKLSFKAGNLLIIMEPVTRPWAYAKLLDSHGWIPMNYVQIL